MRKLVVSFFLIVFLTIIAFAYYASSNSSQDFSIIEHVSVENLAATHQENIIFYFSIPFNTRSVDVSDAHLSIQEIDLEARRLALKIDHMAMGSKLDFTMEYRVKALNSVPDQFEFTAEDYLRSLEKMDSQYIASDSLTAMDVSEPVIALYGIECMNAQHCSSDFISIVREKSQLGFSHTGGIELSAGLFIPFNYLTPSDLSISQSSYYVKQGIVSINRHAFSIAK